MAYVEEHGRTGRPRPASGCWWPAWSAYSLWTKAQGRETADNNAPVHMAELSVVIPIRNEAPIARGAPSRAHRDARRAWGRSYEILVVDDGSTDESFAILARLQAADPHLRVIRFRRNFGQTAAFAAGFEHARGRLIVTSDGDLQNDPRDIPTMVEHARSRATTSSAAGGRSGRIRSSRGGCRR